MYISIDRTLVSSRIVVALEIGHRVSQAGSDCVQLGSESVNDGTVSGAHTSQLN